MIVEPRRWLAIRTGRLTYLRRAMQLGKPCRYVPGRTYAIQPRIRARAIGRVLVTAVEASTAVRKGGATVPVWIVHVLPFQQTRAR